MKLIMENWRKYLLQEAAKGAQDILADKDNIIVMEESDNHVKIVAGNKRTNDQYAYIGISKRSKNCWGAWEVLISFANVDGWGPFVYDIAMEYTGTAGLMADRTTVSKDAISIWNFYLEKRSDDVKPKQLDWINQPFITPSDVRDDCVQDKFMNSYIMQDDEFDPSSKLDIDNYMNSSITKAYIKITGKPIINMLDREKRILWR